MKTNIYRKATAPIVAVAIAMMASLAQGDIVLYPGYISGTFSIGDYNVYSANISATGGGYASSKSVGDDAASLSIPYTLTVQGGDWDYNVDASAYMRESSGSYYPYTYMTFNRRTFPVAIGETRSNDYTVTPGTIRFEVSISGDPYSSWYAYGYASRNMDPPAEKTYSQGYTNSSYTPGGSWYMPVVPNEQIRIYARVYVDNKRYDFWTASTDIRSEDIAAGETMVIPLNVVHEALDPPEPPTYDYGSVSGSINLQLNEPERFGRHRVTGYGSRYLYNNPDSYLFEYVQTGLRTFRAETWFDDYRTFLRWPYTDGDYLNDRIDVQKDMTYTKDFFGQTGRLEGELLYTGTLANQDLNSYSLYAYGASNFWDSDNNVWVRQPTYGGYAYISKYGTNTDNRYRLLLNPGPWLPYQLNASSSNYDNGYYTSFSLNIYDYNHYYDGSTYDFGQPVNIASGLLVQQDREYCTGSVVVRFRDDDGGLLSSPTVSGSGNRYTDVGKRELRASISGSSGVSNVLEPEVEVHGPPGDYNLSNLRIITQDGSRITFPSFPIALECGVRKGVPSSGVPKIVIEHPPAYLITDAETVIVNGTAADDTGVAGVTINGVVVDVTVTGNPDNEVSFSHLFALNPGTNTIRTEAVDPQGNLSYDERDVYAERWPPAVSITSPAGGAITDSETPIAVEIQAADRGFGFSLTVSVDGVVIHEDAGPVNEHAVETLSFNESIGPLDVGEHVIRAEVSDAIGSTVTDHVTITVIPANEAPVAYDDTVTTPEDTPVLIDVAANDTDADGNLDPGTATVQSGPATGSLINIGDGTFSYRPNLNMFGADSFIYQVCDTEGLCAMATVTINISSVNDLPVAGEDVYVTDEDTPLSVVAPGLLANDTDVDVVDSISVTGTTQPANGSVSVNADGSFSYTPNADYNGADSFTYTVSDGNGGADTGTVSLTINPVNDLPVANADGLYSTNEDVARVVVAPGVLANDTDVDGDALTASLATAPANGTVVVNADGAFSYTPNADYYGADSFTYQVSDGNGGTDTGIVSLDIYSVNDLPLANDDAYDTDEDVELVVATALGLLANDSDVDGDALTVSLQTAPANGTVVVTTDGAFSYTPNADYYGADSFTYTVSDGNGGADTGTVSLTINPVNDLPVANADGLYSTNEDVARVVVAPGVLANDTDVDGDALMASLATAPANGTVVVNADGAFSYTPNADYYGVDSFTYQVSDGNGGTDTGIVSLVIYSVNDLPLASDDAYDTDEDVELVVATALGLLANDFDVDGDALTVISPQTKTATAHGTVAVIADGSFSYTPNPDYYGSDSFTYVVSDGNGGTASGTVSLTINPVNDIPVLSVDVESQSVQYSDPIATVTISAKDVDSKPTELTASWTELASLSPSGGCSPSADGSSCSWTLDGKVEVGAGTHTIALTLNDGEFAPSIGTKVVVTAEDASAAFDDGNPVSVRVASDGGNSGYFELVVHVTETVPDLPAERASPGDIALAEVTMTLEPVGSGSSASSTCTSVNSGSGYDAVQTVTCTFDTVPVNTYTAVVSVGGDYYTGAAEDVMTVYDPSLGFTTGGGWFRWPVTGEKTNFGYTMKYGKNGNNVKGSLLLIRHLPDGAKYRIKSNALSGLAVGQDPEVPYGWASFSGKSTYLEPGMPEPEGNHQFTAYVEDRDEPGTGNDRFWITVRGKDGLRIPVMSMEEPAPANAVSIQGGNIVAPH